MLLVINADDFGYCNERNKGIVELYNLGALTDTSLLVNARATEAAVELIKEHNIPAGLHLNLTEGLPLSSEATAKCLVGKDGKFLGKFGFREALRDGRITSLSIEAEIRAQIERFSHLLGAYPTHVDGHQHVHVLQGVRDMFAGLLHDYGIQMTRLPAERGVDDCPWLSLEARAFRSEVARHALESANVFDSQQIRYPDAFIGMRTMGSDMSVERVMEQLRDIQATPGKITDRLATCEWMVHPGYASVSSDGGCSVDGPDEFSRSLEREHEMSVLGSCSLRAAMDAAGVARCTYSQLLPSPASIHVCKAGADQLMSS